MKTILTIIFIIIAVFAYGQDNRGYMENTDYTGGLNLSTDSASLKPNEAVILDNLLFDKHGSLEKRPGIKYWNKNQTIGSDIIKDIHYFSTSAGTRKTMIASQNWLYAINSADTTPTDWSTYRVGYSRGLVHMHTNKDTVWGDTTWWLLGIKKGDYLFFKDTTFIVDSILTDSTLKLNKTYKLSDTTHQSYKIYRYLNSSVSNIVSWNNNAYVGNDEIPAFYYDSSQCRWLACVDSGKVDILSRKSTVIYSLSCSLLIPVKLYSPPPELPNFPTIKRYTKTIYIPIADSIVAESIITMWISHQQVVIRHKDFLGSDTMAIKERLITSYEDYRTDIGYRFQVSDGVIWDHGDLTNWYRLTGDQIIGQVDSFAIIDTSKNFNALNNTRYIVFGANPYRPFKMLVFPENKLGLIKMDTSVWIYSGSDSLKLKGRYYIFETIPFTSGYSTYTELQSPTFKQILFHDNILFAYGHQLDSLADTINQSFVYHSDIGLPKQFKTLSSDGLTINECGFDLSLNPEDRPTSLFELHDRLIITTKNKTYALLGYPPAIGEGNLINVLPNLGIPSYNAVITRDNNYAYFANTQGFYLFDGNGVDKISLPIEPLINNYLTSDYELGYFRDNVYFGFNDSNYTLLYHEPTKTFTRLRFGIECMNHQSVSSDSGYFLFAHHTLGARRIFKYPIEGLYADSLNSTSATSIPIRFKTGWMALDGLSWNKAFDAFYVMMSRHSDAINFYFRTDFDTTTIQHILFDTPSCAGCNYLTAKRLPLSQNLKGRYIQLEVYGLSANYFSLGRYGLEWTRESNY